MNIETEGLSSILRTISKCLEYPVILVLILLAAAVVFLTGSLIAECVSERRHLKVNMPKLVDDLRAGERSAQECIVQSSILKRQKAILVELTRHPDLNETMREALAVNLVEEEQERLEKRVQITDMIAKIGPILGLLGTLIPLGPGIVALAEGDTYTLAGSLLTAFDTTVAGLAIATAAMLISAVRKNWYKKYMSIMDALAECVLEVEKNRG